MIEQILILLMTILTGFLCLFSAGLAVWYWMQGAFWSGVLQFCAFAMTFLAVQMGLWWIRHKWR